MSVPSYLYTHNHQSGTLVIGDGDESFQFQTWDGNTYALSLDDVIDLDTPEAAFLAEADAMVGAWRDLCQSAADLPDPETARQTLRECLEVMELAIDTGGGTNPAPAVALKSAA